MIIKEILKEKLRTRVALESSHSWAVLALFLSQFSASEILSLLNCIHSTVLVIELVRGV